MVWDSYRAQLVTISERIISDLSIAGRESDALRMAETLASIEAAIAGIDAAQAALESSSGFVPAAVTGAPGEPDVGSETA